MSPFREQIAADGDVRARAARVRRLSNGSPEQLVREVQRLWILSAMAKVACEQGPESATVAQIAARAGVSRSMFYELFKNREACFLATFDEAVERAGETAIVAYEAEDRWVDRVRAGLESLLVFFDEEPELARVCVVHALAAGPQALARRAEVLDTLIEAVEEGCRPTRAGIQPPSLTAESVVGGALAVIHARLLESSPKRLAGLLNPLMFMIVLPCLGPAAARRELARPITPSPSPRAKQKGARDPLEDLDLRLTHRTLRVLAAIAAAPGVSNREVAEAVEVRDQGQISKLLARLQRHGLARNTGPGQLNGGANAWTLTSRGAEVGRAAGRAYGRAGRNGHAER